MPDYDEITIVVPGEIVPWKRAQKRRNKDGTFMLADFDRTARLWDAASGAELTVLRGHDGAVASAVFDPSGRRVLTASSDHTARLWDAASGAELAVLRGHEASVTSAVFDPLGARVVTASGDNMARIWRAFPTVVSLVEYARAIMPRELTPSLRKQFFLD
jgi:WD40 repeat protein